MVRLPKNAASLTCTTEMSLHDLLDRYLCAVEASPRYVESLRRTVRKAESSGLVDIGQLVPDAVNFWLSKIPLGQTTRHNIRRELLTLWRYAYDCGLTNSPPLRIRRISPARKPPQTWTREGLQKMLDLAAEDHTPVSRRVKARRSDILPAWIGLGYDSGLRFSDVLALTARDIRNGCVAVTAAKTGKPLVRRLSPATVQAVDRLIELSPDGTLFSWALPRRRAILMWRRFLDQHKLGGSSKWLRRACATQLDMSRPGAATEYLQHSSPSLARWHYIDASQAGVPEPPPPIAASCGYPATAPVAAECCPPTASPAQLCRAGRNASAG